MEGAEVQRLESYFQKIGEVLEEESRRGSFALYAMGLLGDGERKSVEPIAARACPAPKRVDAMHQRLLHFTVDSKWSDRDVRRVAAQYALEAMTKREPVEAWIVDDTGFLKQGKHSVGVQRQYTGSAGKVTNCQIGVSLSIATRTEHVPIDFELYLPDSWANDIARRVEARIPPEVRFKTKPQLALQMIDRAMEDGVPPGIVLADSAYGSSSQFRSHLRSLGLHYAVAVSSQTTVYLLDDKGRAREESQSVSDLAFSIQEAGGFRRCTWRKGTRKNLSARFALRRVNAAGVSQSEQEPLWLLIEWRDGEPEPANYHYCVRDRSKVECATGGWAGKPWLHWPPPVCLPNIRSLRNECVKRLPYR
ncbi:Transposase [Stigmatella aurantiaca DW4/3-1]|uniref:Transposase n=1 Tax=Stigmatella aurantiaca (strain DW4/3-1) TaxID=378806 RepID=Q08YH4_STIAD|nr:IS701 family transposase [Stigmatella aurantiaca]ADO70240.1 Transposase [Stigmatella aurantiaca DW4/3-1]EAU65520.1 isrso17-transposase protein [Stigmatella aurantiaca DW4/3-1]